MRQQKMKSFWTELVPDSYEYCDTEITEFIYSDEPGRNVEISIDVLPYDKDDLPGKLIKKRIAALDSFIFNPPRKDLVVGQALKGAYVYPEIIRIDLVTTGPLLRIECESYEISTI